ncbi:Glycerol-3-phosphate dehydrogenase [Fusarium oxysporum f. sp. albedinis]|nr:Glycerol-3-phosphate dehydrogenase [Fusarium oxysporum f. sp. albedinis]
MSIYQQYKPTKTLKKSNGNGKGKGHIRAKNKKTQEKQDPSTKKYVIRVRDFEAMAKHVAETNAVAVPHRTAVALERGIWGFDDHSLRSSQRAVQEGIAAGASYSHFVEVLEKVRGYLKPIMEAVLFKPDDLDKKTDVKTNHTAKGMFDVLGEEVTWEDAFFAFTTLLRDYAYLSQEIHSLWEKYANGELDLATVALATNTAFEFAHSMEMDIKKVMDKFGGTTVFAQLCFNAACEGLGIDKERNSRGAMYNLAAYDVAKVLTLNSMGLFKSLVDHNRDAVISGSYNGAFGWYEERLGAGGGNNTERRNRDKTALSEIFPGFHFLNTTPGQGDVEDELVRGMGAALKEKKENPRLWISWALQMYLDIVQGLGESVGRGYEQFKQESLKIQKALVDLPKTAERRQVLQVATRWNHDPIYETNQSMMEFGAMAHSDDNAAFPFLRRNPIYCGLLIHHTRSMLHVNGVKAAAPSRGLMTTTQLYQALR